MARVIGIRVHMPRAWDHDGRADNAAPRETRDHLDGTQLSMDRKSGALAIVDNTGTVTAVYSQGEWAFADRIYTDGDE